MTTFTLEEGRNYLFESVTSNIFVGRLVKIAGPHTVVLEKAAWVSETGRLGEFMAKGKAYGTSGEVTTEVEPVGVQCVHWAGWRPWPHPLFDKAI